MRHIMVATDGSSGADRAVDVAAEIARALSGDLLIVTVADSLAFEEAQQVAHTEGSVGDVLELDEATGPLRVTRIARSPLRRANRLRLR